MKLKTSFALFSFQMSKNVNPYFYREFLEQLSVDIGSLDGSSSSRRRRREARKQEQQQLQLRNHYSPADREAAAIVKDGDSSDGGNGDGICLMKFENDRGGNAETVKA